MLDIFGSFQDFLSHGYILSQKKGTAELDLIQTAPTLPRSKIKLEVYNTDKEIFESIMTSNRKATFTYYIFGLEMGSNTVMDFEDRVSSQIGIGLQKDSELTDVFNYHILDMIQGGIVKHLIQKWVFKKPTDYTSRIFGQDAKPIGTENMYFPVSLLSAGVIVCLTVLSIEFSQCKLGLS